MSDRSIIEITDRLSLSGDVSDYDFKVLLTEALSLNRDLRDACTPSDLSATTRILMQAADERRKKVFGEDVYIRGLIEFTNYCKNNCYYCGIRCGNQNADRYRLSCEDILDCCKQAYEAGFRTFVLQGGEDAYYTDERVCEIVSAIKNVYPDCAVTLSIGEKSRASYEAYRLAGANRFLLRHESADDAHYAKLHPDNLSLDNRKRCLFDLKELGFSVGAGFMVGSPFQTPDCIIKDIRFLQTLAPHMIGIGPFISHKDTPFADAPDGSAELTLRLIAILRLVFPYANIPSTTAMGTILPYGRELGLMAGANVVMPNISPMAARRRYTLYEKKRYVGEEAIEGFAQLKERIKKAGYRIVVGVGDSKMP